MNDDYTKAIIEKIHAWTYDVLNDDEKLDAWVEERKTLNKLDEYGLLAKKERNRIIAEVNKKKRLDELFGV
jgi:predicted transcriptional regulator YheO